jgi:hypothetical protein
MMIRYVLALLLVCIASTASALTTSFNITVTITGGGGTPIFSCLSSSFTNTNTPCGVGGLVAGSGTAFKVVGANGSFTPVIASGNVQLLDTVTTHTAIVMNYQTAVNVQAFTATLQFIPNGQNISFVLNNTNNNGGNNGPNFSSGAGCEGGIYQGFTPNPWVNNIMALMFESYGGNTAGSGTFTYSSAQLYQVQQSPCNPNDGSPGYWGTNKISTSPVALNSPAGTLNTTTGHIYQATISYDGTNLGVCLYDATLANGSCLSGMAGTGTFFQQTWSAVNIPAMVNGNTAYVGVAEGNGLVGVAPLYVVGLSYTVNSPPALPSLSTYTTQSYAGASAAATPTFSPAAGTYAGTQNVTISSATGGSYICYRLAAPSQTLVLPWPDNGGSGTGACFAGATLYTGPVAVSSSQTLYAVAATTFTGLPSAQAAAAYTINSALTQVFNCSGFATAGNNLTGNCGVRFPGSSFGTTMQALGASGNSSFPFISGNTLVLNPANADHNAMNVNYELANVNVGKFSSNFTFVPNGWNVAFVLSNNTVPSGGTAANGTFAGGAGCEGSFFQGFTDGTGPPINTFALQLDQWSSLLPQPGGGTPNFTYSSVQYYVTGQHPPNAPSSPPGQSPCNPDLGKNSGDNSWSYASVDKVSTSPVPLNNPPGTLLTTTGDNYSATVTYDSSVAGGTLTISLFDVTAGGSCPGTNCFTNTWTGVNIPAIVGGSTAWVGLAGGTNNSVPNPLVINSFNYFSN